MPLRFRTDDRLGYDVKLKRERQRCDRAMTVTAAKWTIDEYHRMISAGILDNRRVELLKGEIVEMPPEGEPPRLF